MIHIDKTWIPADKLLEINSRLYECQNLVGNVHLVLTQGGFMKFFVTREPVILADGLNLTLKCLRDCRLDLISFDGGGFNTCGTYIIRHLFEGTDYSIQFIGGRFRAEVIK